MNLQKIISGGQTGVDRGAIGAALQLGFPYGGWIPDGRQAEDGQVPACFTEMKEMGGGYLVRTRRNVESACGTLILNVGAVLTGGTRRTVEIAEKDGGLMLVLDVNQFLLALRHRDDDVGLLQGVLIDQVMAWLPRKWQGIHPLRTLNVAGPRESKAPGIEGMTFSLMTHVLSRVMGRVVQSPVRST